MWLGLSRDWADVGLAWTALARAKGGTGRGLDAIFDQGHSAVRYMKVGLAGSWLDCNNGLQDI